MGYYKFIFKKFFVDIYEPTGSCIYGGIYTCAGVGGVCTGKLQKAVWR